MRCTLGWLKVEVGWRLGCKLEAKVKLGTGLKIEVGVTVGLGVAAADLLDYIPGSIQRYCVSTSYSIIKYFYRWPRSPIELYYCIHVDSASVAHEYKIMSAQWASGRKPLPTGE